MPLRCPRPSLAAAVLAVALAAVPLVASALAPGTVAPPFTARQLNGHGNLSLSRFKGKPVYLNFFASWCGPCNDEAAGIGILYKRYHAKGLDVVGIDSDSAPQSGADFVKRYGWTFPAVDDSSGDVTRAYGGVGLPVHVFIDKQGRISTYRLGEMSPGEIDAAIHKIL